MGCRILLVEDEILMQEIVSDFFREMGDEIRTASTGAEALNLIRTEDFHIVLLDVMLPGMNGFRVCEHIKQIRDIPVIFLTAMQLEEDMLRGYELGADDYVTKPFSLKVLYAKVHAVMARSVQHDITDSKTQNERIVAGNIEIDQDLCCMKISGEQIKLTAREYDILLFLILHPKQIYNRQQLLDKFWPELYEGSDRVVDNHIKNIRKKLGDEEWHIKTSSKRGYYFE